MLAWLHFKEQSRHGSLFIYQNGAQKISLTESSRQTLTGQQSTDLQSDFVIVDGKSF
ncbi:hypothetical protein [Pseudomonas fluorescens]|uniref:Uncharacterized protein n=1 Tax=Pseudomonas fluorescens TaxID=294 RepID=A0A5E7SML7_PSEFL|nr:hypothetical protein [Pseudomonas fluorescens]VVP87334.1 hypothetical protein PS941_01335 [Pseudomonas fluorescens]